MQKSTIVDALSEFPKKINLDEFLERLIVIEKLDEGMEEVTPVKPLAMTG